MIVYLNQKTKTNFCLDPAINARLLVPVVYNLNIKCIWKQHQTAVKIQSEKNNVQKAATGLERLEIALHDCGLTFF